MNLPFTVLQKTALALLVVLFAAFAAGCSSGPPVLAKVGDRSITTDDFMDAARANPGQYAGSADSAKATLLDDLVERALLVAEASKRGLVSAEDQARLLRRAEDELAVRALIQKLAPPDVPVSDAEVAELYRQRATEAHALVVFTPDEAACRQAFAELGRGTAFGVVADRFNTTGMTPPGGDIGYIAPGSLPPAIDKAVMEAPLGKVLGPVESPGDGWFIIQVVERRPRQQEPFEAIRERLKMALRQGKQRVQVNRVTQDLLAQYHVQIEPGAPQAFFMRYNAPKDTIQVGGTRMPVPAAPTPEEARRPLVRHDGADGKPAAYTMGDAVNDLRDPTRPRPNFTMLPLIEQWLRSMALQRVAIIEAHRRKLEQEPSLARQARQRVNNELLQAAYNALVMPRVSPPTEAEIRANFERRAPQLARLSGARVRFTVLPDSGTAAAVGRAASGGAGLEGAVRASGARASVTETQIRYPSADPLWSQLEGALMSMKPGDVSPPFPGPGGWMVLQAVSTTVVPPVFAKLDPAIRQALESEAYELKREQALRDVVAGLRSQYAPVLHRERLTRVSWPVPPAKPGT